MSMRNDFLIDKVVLRHARATDGYQLHQLVAASPPLDTNSVYCNLLQCQHFAETSVAALSGDKLIGFISGYLLPSDPETLFIWQVVVADKARGNGLAKRMLNWLVDQPSTESARHLITSITPDNQASWMLFEGLAQAWQAQASKSMLFERERHFANLHDDEYLLRVTPLPNRQQQSTAASYSNLRSNYSDLRSSLRLPPGRRWLD